MSKNTAIEVKNITKMFKIPTEPDNGVKQAAINMLKGKKAYREFTPIDGVSFTINKGDFFGIVGRNGSGKSTLLKTIAGIYQPELGSVQVDGSLVPFIELGVGFNPELTGRENVYLNGALLGFSRLEMQEMYSSIVDFAELEDFMDERLKNYSSGMQVRLAFSIAIRAKADILLLDEVLAVGDSNFQRKCFEYFNHLKKGDTTVVLVSHDANAVQRYCNKAILLEGGKIIKKGTPAEIFDKYASENIKKLNQTKDKPSQKIETGGKITVSLKGIFHKDKKTKSFLYGQLMTIDIDITAQVDIDDGCVVRYVLTPSGGGAAMFGAESGDAMLKKIEKGSTHRISFSARNIFDEEDLTLHVSVMDADSAVVLARITNAAKIATLKRDVALRTRVYVETEVTTCLLDE